MQSPEGEILIAGGVSNRTNVCFDFQNRQQFVQRFSHFRAVASGQDNEFSFALLRIGKNLLRILDQVWGSLRSSQQKD